MNVNLSRSRTLTARLAVVLVFLFGITNATGAEPADPGGGIGGTGISGFGLVQKFGSVFVNGREYFIDRNTRVTRDGAPGTENMLHLGDVVRVEGRIDLASGRSVATRIDRQLALQGVVETVNTSSATLTVLGQTVHVTPATLSDNPAKTPLLKRLSPGDRLAISGLVRADNSITATHVARLAANELRFVLRGKIQFIDREHGRLKVGRQELIGKLSQPFAVGDVVRIGGRYGDGVGVLQLESVAIDRPTFAGAGQLVEMSGYVQGHPNAGQLLSNNVVLRYSDTTAIRGGVAADLRTDVPMAVRGESRSDGSVVVHEILLNVEPMGVVLPEFHAATPNAGDEHGQHQATENDRGDRVEVERDEAGVHGAEHPGRLEVEKPEAAAIERPSIERPELDLPTIDRPEVEKGGIE